MEKTFMKQVTWYLVVAMFVIGITPRVYAEFSPSEVVGVLQMDREADLGKIQNAIETKMVGERLKQIGFTSDEVLKKLSQLSDQEIHQLALQLDELKVGSDGGWVVLVIVIVLVAIAVVVLYTKGHKVVIQ
jgi:hypothetical protein